MVVNGKGNLCAVSALHVLAEQHGVGNINAEDKAVLKIIALRDKKAIFFGYRVVAYKPCLFSELPERAKQGKACAERVPVRICVGKNDKIVVIV